MKLTAAPGNEDWISLVTSAVQIFPGVSIATATSHSLTEQSMTHTYLEPMSTVTGASDRDESERVKSWARYRKLLLTMN